MEKKIILNCFFIRNQLPFKGPLARRKSPFISNQNYYVVKAGASLTFPTTSCQYFYLLTKGDTYKVESEYHLGYCKIGDRDFNLITFIPLAPAVIVH